MLQRRNPSAKSFGETATNGRGTKQIYKDQKSVQLAISTAIRLKNFKTTLLRSFIAGKSRASDNQEHANLSANTITSDRSYQAERTAQNLELEEIFINATCPNSLNPAITVLFSFSQL